MPGCLFLALLSACGGPVSPPPIAPTLPPVTCASFTLIGPREEMLLAEVDLVGTDLRPDPARTLERTWSEAHDGSLTLERTGDRARLVVASRDPSACAGLASLLEARSRRYAALERERAARMPLRLAELRARREDALAAQQRFARAHGDPSELRSRVAILASMIDRARGTRRWALEAQRGELDDRILAGDRLESELRGLDAELAHASVTPAILPERAPILASRCAPATCGATNAAAD